jgi:CRP-like cAMP-binding protein
MLGGAEAAALRTMSREREAPAGSVLLHASAPGDSLLILLRGRAKVVSRTPDGRETVLAIAGPGDLVGELAALDGRTRCADVIALEPVRVGVLSSVQLRNFLAERPTAALALMRMLAARMREANRERVQIATDDSLGRVALRLLELAERYGEPVASGVRIELAMTQEELAGWIGASRGTVARALRLMRRLGWVVTSRRAITVLDIDALRERRAAIAA